MNFLSLRLNYCSPEAVRNEIVLQLSTLIRIFFGQSSTLLQSLCASLVRYFRDFLGLMSLFQLAPNDRRGVFLAEVGRVLLHGSIISPFRRPSP